MASKKLLAASVLTAWAVACFCLFQGCFKFHFYFLEQNQLFLCSGAYLAEYFRDPAWLSRMVGEFLQQFYHYPCAGAVLLTVTLLAAGHACYRAFRKMLPPRRDNRLREWTAFVLALLVMTVEARLFVYENAQLASVISLAAGAWIWVAVDRMRNMEAKWWQVRFSLLFVLACALSYWTAGYGMFVMILLELLRCIFAKRIPVAALVSLAVALAVSGPVCKSYRIEKKDALLCPGVGKWIKLEPALKVETTLKYYQLYCRGDYRSVIQLYESSKDKKHKNMTFIYSLALSQYGMLPDRISYMKEPFIGTSVHLGGDSPMMLSLMMSELYYLIGDMTYAERVCMHANNFSIHKRSAYLVRRLAEINLVSEDFAAADKYLRMLKKSPVYRKWAEDHTPGTMDEDVEKALSSKRKFINRNAEVRVGDNCRTMLHGLLDTNGGNEIALDYLLCTDLLEGNRQNFFDDYAKYGPRDKKLYRQIVEQTKTRR